MKKITILGAGESGIGAALLAKAQGYDVFVSDAGNIAETRKALLVEKGIEYEEGSHRSARIMEAEEMVKSPGISFDHPMVQEAMKKGISVIDELELASRYSRGKIIAVTGTNGKTTTSLLTYHLLKTGGLNVGIGGNIGKSWAAQLAEYDHDWWVLEVSSFQIEGFRTFKPHIALLTNITPDHLDRYAFDLGRYVQAKMKLLNGMDNTDHLICFLDDVNIRNGLKQVVDGPTVHGVSLRGMSEHGGYFDGNEVAVDFDNRRLSISKKDIALRGDHNMINVMEALYTALIVGIDETSLRQGVKDFKNASHRLEESGQVGGVTFVNDSKATNVDATAYALAAFQEPLIWIAGGVDKGNDYALLHPLVKGRVKALVCLGTDNSKLTDAFSGWIGDIVETQDMEEAVRLAFEKSNKGDVVLLSPACASFDLFRNYEDRGDRFKRAVEVLKSNNQ